jgi:uncharacterized membrane protein YkvA (DUF1232 family)
MKALNNAIEHATGSAVSILKDRTRTRRLLDSTVQRLANSRSTFDAKGLTGKIHAAIRMVRLSVRREYRELPWQSLVLITAGLIYFVSPADAIPDIIPMLGFTDDAAILAAIFASISRDLDRFIEWERSSLETAAAHPETGNPDSSGEN